MNALGLGSSNDAVALQEGGPRLHAADHEAVSLTVQAGSTSTTVRAKYGQTLLDAALAGGVPLPFGCRVGDCGVCKCELLEGRVDEGWAEPLALPAHERAQRRVLACTSVLRGPVVVRVNALDQVAPRKATMRVMTLDRRTEDVVVFRVAAERGRIVPFLPGQYVKLTLPNGAIRDFSIASGPKAPFLEFHIRRRQGGRASSYAYENLRVGDDVGIAGPLGDSVLHDDSRPIIAVCGGTGYAPLKSIVQHALAARSGRSVRLYWFARGRQDVYDQESLRRLAAEHPGFNLTILARSDVGPCGGNKLAQLISEATAGGSIASHVHAAGPTRLVAAIRDAALAAGLPETDFHADPFGDLP